MAKVSGTGTPGHLQLLRDETVFNSILKNLNSGVALIDDKGRFVSYNPKFLSLFGLSEESTIKNVNDQNWAEWQVFSEDLKILHVDDHPVRKAAITGSSVRNQLVAVRLPSGGDLIWMLVSAEPVFNAQGRIEKTVCTYLDVTDQKLADVALRRSEQRYRELFNSMSEIFQVVELVHDKNGKAVDYYFRDINPAFEKLVSKSKDRLLNKSAKELFGDLNPEWYRIFEKVYKSGQPTRFESHGYVADRYFEFFAWRTPENNIAIISSDITQRRAAELVLHENEIRLSELNATKDRLFSIISHDLKSPFTSIIGFCELLINKLEAGDLKAGAKFAKIILESSWQAMDLLTNLIEWSRVQTKKMVFNPVSIDLVGVIKETTGLISASASQKSIEISVETPEKLYLNADRTMISTVLRNLISNAVKFTKSGGRIIVSGHAEDHKVILEVTDNGIGMTSNTISGLFDPESTLSTPGTANETGMGLGMIICREFVSKHDGQIRVESEIGKGSRFIISFPS